MKNNGSAESLGHPIARRFRTMWAAGQTALGALLRGPDIAPIPVQKRSPEETERFLVANFTAAIDALDFSELAVIPEGRKRPRSLGEFRLVPVVATNPLHNGSLERKGSSVILPDGVVATYSNPVRRPDGAPYLDAGFGIGLVRGDWLVAVSTAGIDPQGSLRIQQIQDVSKSTEERNKDRGGRYATGLHDGFLWRDTLISAWVQTAYSLSIGDQVTVQSSYNNAWGLNDKPQLYDEPALRLGFTKSVDGNFTVPLPPPLELTTNGTGIVLPTVTLPAPAHIES